MSLQLFDKKLAELDAYLQMLIAESEGLDSKISDADKESERGGLLLIKQNLETLLSSIKHGIVVLQIAKVSVRTDDDCITNLSRNPKLSYKQRLLSGNHQQSPTVLAAAAGASKYKSRNSQQQSESGSSRCGSICETSNSTGTDSDQVALINSTTSPQPPARSSKRRSQQQQQPRKPRQESPASSSCNIAGNNNPQRFLQQRFKSSSSGGSSSIESASLAGAEPSKLSIASTSEANKAQYQYRDSNDPNVNNINESSASSSAFVHVEHDDDDDDELNAHNGSRAFDDKSLITGEGVKTNAELEHGEEDEDDDAFFDAADDQQQQQNNYIGEQQRQQQLYYQDQESTHSQNTTKTKDHLDNNIVGPNYLFDNSEQDQNENSASNMSSSRRGDLSNNNNNIIPEETIDWDLLYEEEDEEDLGSLEGQGSVIKHLLSQIRIGMDLTKVVLPTFILERRSLLEMYADFFAHPDLFSSIPDYDTPEERMIQVVRWYLSAFHAGRKSSVAKKPYNPILGEIFLCHWKFDNKGNKQSNSPRGDQVNNNNKNKSTSDKESSNQVESTNTNSSSDIEQFTKSLPENSLLFVAEQVSHHPPVSAFYAENREKRITCCAHIYTKSKYLGLSVGVHNIGQGEIKLLKHNEIYVCTFPSAYGRSILTVPWVELGGSVNITCEQTGYSAKLEFVTKPFYGGKKHRVIGEILRPNNEPFLSIDGEWNGCMYSKSPPNSSEKKVFVDTTRLPVIKKNVRPVSTQESFESRNVWKEVTRALKLRDVTTATAAKSYIEQRQRDLLKDRTEKGLKWKTRYFEANDNGWDYAKPLSID